MHRKVKMGVLRVKWKKKSDLQKSDAQKKKLIVFLFFADYQGLGG